MASVTITFIYYRQQYKFVCMYKRRLNVMFDESFQNDYSLGELPLNILSVLAFIQD